MMCVKKDKGGGVMYKKHKIPKKIVDKITHRNKLNKEIEKWCNENLDMDGMCSLYADITRSKFGYEQGTKDINKAQGYTLYRLSKALKCNIEDILERV